MSLYKRGNVYWYKFRHSSVLYCKSTGTGNERLAGQIENVAKTAVYQGKAELGPKGEAPTLKDFEEQFMAEISARCAEHPETISFYKCKYNALLHYGKLADKTLDRIDSRLMDEFTRNMLDAGKARGTVNRSLATLRRALRLAAKWKLIVSAPQVELLNGENQRNYVLPIEEQDRYLNACPEFLRNFSLLSLETGCRMKELIGLRWEDITWEPVGKAVRGLILIRGTKSANSRRTLSITARARKVLLLQKEISKCNFVFVREHDATVPASSSTLDHAHSDVRVELDMPTVFVLHSLRHTFLTRLGAAGADAFTIMRVAGHSTITVSQRYIHPTVGQVETAFLNLEKLTGMQEVGTVKQAVGTKRGTVTPISAKRSA